MILNLCLAILLTPGVGKEAAERGCSMAPQFVESAERHNQDPYLLAAIAWKESGFDPQKVGSSGECGVMQVLPRYSRFTCKQMQAADGIEAGARALEGWKGSGSWARALYRYNCGYKTLDRCGRYSREVLGKTKKLQRHAPKDVNAKEETKRGVGAIDPRGPV